MKKQTWEEGLAHAHQTFYDETGIEISLAIDRALKKILSDHDREIVEGLEKYVVNGVVGWTVVKSFFNAQEFIKKGENYV